MNYLVLCAARYKLSGGMLTRAAAIRFQNISDKTVKNAQILVGAIPILMIYPFLQRYFLTGLIIGSVKE